MPKLEIVIGIIAAILAAWALVVRVKDFNRRKEKDTADARTKLRAALNDMDLVRKGIEDFLESANHSRTAVMSAIGHWNGGAGEIWRKQFDKDKAELHRLLVSAPKDTGFEKTSRPELDEQLAAVHRLTGELRKIREKYQRCMAEDERSRRDISDRHHR